jgi:hypothetical protein
MQGSCNAGYRHAFHIQRAGASFNFNAELMRGAGVMLLYTPISLSELFWHLTGVKPMQQQ